VVQEYVAKNQIVDISSLVIESPEYVVQLIEELKGEGYDIILDIDIDVFKRENPQNLLKVLSQITKKVSLTTCATSPGYIDQEKSIAILKKFLSYALD